MNYCDRMKLKIEHNSVRLRLSEEDIERFVSEGALSESCSFGSGMDLIFLLEVGGSSLAASFDDRTLAISIPREMSDSMTLGGGIGFTRIHENDDGSMLEIIVERDLGRRRK